LKNKILGQIFISLLTLKKFKNFLIRKRIRTWNQDQKVLIYSILNTAFWFRFVSGFCFFRLQPVCSRFAPGLFPVCSRFVSGLLPVCSRFAPGLFRFGSSLVPVWFVYFRFACEPKVFD